MKTIYQIQKILRGEGTSKEKTALVFRLIFSTIGVGLVTFLIMFLISIVLLIVVISGGASGGGEVEEGGESFPPEVLVWKSKVEKECKKNGIPQATNYILAIIMVESGGNASRTPDIMQCSESQGRPPNSIQDPNESIEIGVKYFADMFKGHPKTDLLNVVQAYNYGGGFLNYAGDSYSLDKAISFSKERAGGQQVSYLNPIAIALGYSYRYNYGNMFYAQLVKPYLSTKGKGGNGKGNKKIVQVALKELGNHGGQKFWSWYGYSGRVEWCATFVSWCANQSNVSIDKFAYCPTGIQNFKNKKQWIGKGSTPKEGNIIFFDWNGDNVSDHVGIVKEVKGDTVYTVEGNSGDMVAERNYKKNSVWIMGYGTP